MFYTLGLVLLSGVTYYVRNWVYLALATSTPFTLYFIYWWQVKNIFIIVEHEHGHCGFILELACPVCVCHTTRLDVAHKHTSNIILRYRFLPESPRWLLAKGRIEEALKILETLARINGTVLPDSFKQKLKVRRYSLFFLIIFRLVIYIPTIKYL